MIAEREWNSLAAGPCSILSRHSVPILINAGICEDHCKTILAAISFCNDKGHLQRPKALRIELTSEEDLFFMHVLEVTEEDFLTLKADQGILVDFLGFPEKVAGLLERCLKSRKDVSHRIIETNDFKELTHISLHFRPANDTSIKELLASQLREARKNEANLTHALAQSKAECSSFSQGLSERGQAIQELRKEFSQQMSASDLNAKSELALEQKRHADELAQINDRLQRSCGENAKQLQKQQEMHQRNANELSQEVQTLERHAAVLKSGLHDADRRTSDLQGNNKTLEGKLQALKSAAADNASEAVKAAEEMKCLQTSLMKSEEKALKYMDANKEQSERVQVLEAAIHAVEDKSNSVMEWGSCNERRAVEASSQAQHAEQIADKLAEDLRMLKDKLKRKQAVIDRQEEDLRARERTLKEADNVAKEKSRATHDTREELFACKEENTALREKLEECTRQLQSNGQMIRWLNDQMNEAHKAYRAGLDYRGLNMHASMPDSRQNQNTPVGDAGGGATAAGTWSKDSLQVLDDGPTIVTPNRA